MKKYIQMCFLVLASWACASAQVTLPPGGANQKSIVKQYIGGIASVTIVYNSPDVTGPNGQSRKGQIWGQLVPYGLTDLGFGLRNPSPWRAGANENTTIKFSHDMLIQGQAIKAGKYGFHIVVEDEGPWTIILSKDNQAWGSFFYDEANDALRVQATPEDNEFHEWLTYEFTDRQATQATAALMWENKKLPFTISVPNMEEIYIASLQSELQSAKGFQWQSWNQAANYCLQNDTHLEQGLAWAEQAVNAPFVGQKNFQTLQTKSALLTKLDRTEEAEATMDEALAHPLTTAFQIHQYGRQLIAQDNAERAMDIFKQNFKRFEGAWPTHVGMARGLSALGKYKEALKHAKLALAQAPDQLNQTNLEQAIVRLGNGEDIN